MNKIKLEYGYTMIQKFIKIFILSILPLFIVSCVDIPLIPGI